MLANIAQYYAKLCNIAQFCQTRLITMRSQPNCFEVVVVTDVVVVVVVFVVVVLNVDVVVRLI